jgi:hypothetical protein
MECFILILACCAFLSGCGGDAPVDILGADYRGYVVVSTVATDPGTGPGIVSLFKPDGTLAEIIHDYYSNGAEFVSGSAFVPPHRIVYTVNGSNRLEGFNLAERTTTLLNTSGLVGFALRNLAYSSTDAAVYVVKTTPTAAVDKFDVNTGTRSPLIPATVGLCALVTPYGITRISTTNQIAVISMAVSGRLSIYDHNGGCVSHFAGAAYPALNVGTPTSVAYHAPTNMLLITQATTHQIWAMNLDGTGNVKIFDSPTIINTPRTITTDALGNIYVASIGTDTIEKLTWSGTGSAVRATSVPFIGTQVLSQNVTSISVIE